MNDWFEERRQAVEKELATLAIPGQPARLYDPIRYTLVLGGKRIRPVLTLLGCELYGIPYAKAMPQALAIEIFHNFTLVHDDVMDSADVRRGMSTVHKKWDPHVALLSGDAMLIIACQQLFRAGNEHLQPISSIFMQTALGVCEGQQLDMDFAVGEDVSLTDYLDMIRLKTAVLLSGAMQIGAVIGGAGSGQLEAIRSFTENMGIAFQVRDDYLDAFGNADFGKHIGGDIREGKRTWLTVKALEMADQHTKERLAAAYANADLNLRVQQVLEMYNALDIRTLAEEAVNGYSAKAVHVLETMDGDQKVKTWLRELVDFLMGRTV